MSECRIRKPSVSQQILKLLLDQGSVRPTLTGCVTVELHINQGGVTDSKVSVSERLK